MTTAWEERAKDSLWAGTISGTVVLLSSAFIYAFFSQANPAFETAFSNAFSLNADLGKCSQSFSTIVMAQMVYSIVITLVLVFIGGRCAFKAIMDAEGRKSYCVIAGGALAVGGFLIGLAMTDQGWWLSRISRGLSGRGIPFPQACLSSHEVLYPQLYVISIWLAGLTWIALLTMLSVMRRTELRREDLPRDPKIRAEVLAIRAKYQSQTPSGGAKRGSSTLGLGLIGLVCFVGLAHGLFKAGTAFAKLVLGS